MISFTFAYAVVGGIFVCGLLDRRRSGCGNGKNKTLSVILKTGCGLTVGSLIYKMCMMLLAL